MSRILVLVAFWLIAALPVKAGQYLDWDTWLSSGNAVLGPGEGPFQVNLGAGAGYAPIYLGDDDLEYKPLVMAEVSYRGALFISTQQGLGYNLWRKSQFRAGPRLTIDFGRDSTESATLTGLPDIEPGVQVGVFLESFSGPWRFRFTGDQEVLDGHNGALISIDVAYGGRLTEGTSLFLGGRTSLMSDNYAQAFFSVDATDVRPGRKEFGAASDFRDATVYAQAVALLPAGLYIAFDARATQLLGDAADSPLTKSTTQVFGGAIVGIRF